MPRLFVAVVPPEDVLETIAALPRPELMGLRWTERPQWHVTLRFLGRVDDVAPVVDALSGLPVRAPVAQAGPEVGRFGQRVLHVPVAGLEQLADAVLNATATLGQPPEDRPFTGHLTLARVRVPRSDRAARAREGSGVDLRRLCGGLVSGRWTVDEVCLFESHLSPAGARYEIVARFPLLRPDG